MIKEKALFDHHMHSSFSEDSDQDIDELVQSAINDGKSHFVVTDHSDLIHLPTSGAFCTDMQAYDEKIQELQSVYGKKIKILRGSEIGYEKSIAADIQYFIDKHSFDIVVLSIHSILDGKDFAEEFHNRGEWVYSEDLVQDYFDATLDAVDTIQGAQILGHLDYLFRYLPQGADIDVLPYKKTLRKIFLRLIEKNMALDINTAGIRYGLPFFHPQPQLLQMYFECGGRNVTLGSDAHRLEDVNFGFYNALQTLLKVGFTEYTSYATGEPEQLKIMDVIR